MRLFPLALDFRPPYLADSASDISLLLMPLGQGTLLGYLRTSFSAVTKNPPVVLTTFAPSAAYEAAIRKACPSVEAILPAAEPRRPARRLPAFRLAAHHRLPAASRRRPRPAGAS